MLLARIPSLMLLLVVCSTCTIVIATPSGGGVTEHINPGEFQLSLVDGNLRHWLYATRTSNGFFQTRLNRRWQPVGEQSATLVSQSRLLYVLGTGYELTGDNEYLEAVMRGADFLLKHFCDDQYGGWFWQVSTQGEVLDQRKDTYGHAFVIFGLSHAYRVTKDPRYRQAALNTLQVIKNRLRDGYGGYVTRADRTFAEQTSEKSQNPIMHLFESLLVLHDITDLPEIYQEAEAIAEYVVDKLYQPEYGWIPESYDAAWVPLPQEQGGYIDVGHQFEWAYLLSKAVEKGMQARFLDVGNRLLNTAMELGYNPATGGVYNKLGYDSDVINAETGWWQQCESTRAFMRYASLHQRDQLWVEVDRTLLFADRNLIDHKYGGWFSSAAVPSDKGSNWKVGYHVTGMYTEGLKLTDHISKIH